AHEIVGADVALLRERMRCRDDERNLVAEERTLDDRLLVPGIDGSGRHERDVDRSSAERLDRSARMLDCDDDVEPRDLRAQRCDGRREPPIRRVALADDAEANGRALVLHRAFELGELREHWCGSGDETLAGLRRREALTRAIEQANLELLLR